MTIFSRFKSHVVCTGREITSLSELEPGERCFYFGMRDCKHYAVRDADIPEEFKSVLVPRKEATA